MTPELQFGDEWCGGCGAEIDSRTCGCGDSIEHHGSPMDVSHYPVPIGCDCYRQYSREAYRLWACIRPMLPVGSLQLSEVADLLEPRKPPRRPVSITAEWLTELFSHHADDPDDCPPIGRSRK